MAWVSFINLLHFLGTSLACLGLIMLIFLFIFNVSYFSNCGLPQLPILSFQSFHNFQIYFSTAFRFFNTERNIQLDSAFFQFHGYVTAQGNLC